MHTIKIYFNTYKENYILTHTYNQTMTIINFFGHFGHSGGGVKCYGKMQIKL